MNHIIRSVVSGMAVLLLSTSGSLFGQSTWQTATPLPEPGYLIGAAAGNGYLFTAGGQPGATSLAAAALQPDGSLGAWMTAAALPQPDPSPAVVVAGSHIYLVLTNGAVFHASLAGGTTGSWIPDAPASPSLTMAGSVVAHQGYLYVFGGYGTRAANRLLYAPIQPDGSISVWLSGSLPLALYAPTVQFHEGRVYLVGGLNQLNSAIAMTYSAAVLPDGSIGAWRQEASLPNSLWLSSSFVVTNDMYVLGGRTNVAAGTESDFIYRGTIGTNGAIAQWELVEWMPGLFNTGASAVLAANGRAYLLGGMDTRNGNAVTNHVLRKEYIVQPPVNQAPTALAQSVALDTGTSTNLTLTGTDPDGDSLTYTIVAPPARGSLSGLPPNVTYQPNAGYTGPDSFTFRVSDGKEFSAPAIVSITVREIVTNTPPVARARISPLLKFPGVPLKLVLATNHTEALVVFDGSASSDAEGGALDYFWTTGETVFGVQAIVTNSLAVGSYTVALVVSDGQAADTNTVDFTVVGPSGAVAVIAGMVESSSLPDRRKHALLVTLKVAERAFDRGRVKTGLNLLKAFDNKVRAQVQPTDPELGRDLSAAARTLTRAMGGTPYAGAGLSK